MVIIIINLFVTAFFILSIREVCFSMLTDTWYFSATYLKAGEAEDQWCQTTLKNWVRQLWTTSKTLCSYLPIMLVNKYCQLLLTRVYWLVIFTNDSLLCDNFTPGLIFNIKKEQCTFSLLLCISSAVYIEALNTCQMLHSSFHLNV